MSKCGYYSCFKGKPKCNHPTYGEIRTKSYNLATQCDACRRDCGGIYPNEVPHCDISECVVDIVDADGNVVGWLGMS